jgi:hypothetical protein
MDQHWHTRQKQTVARAIVNEIPYNVRINRSPQSAIAIRATPAFRPLGDQNGGSLNNPRLRLPDTPLTRFQLLSTT